MLTTSKNLLFVFSLVLILTSCKKDEAIKLFDSLESIRQYEASFQSTELTLHDIAPDDIWFISEPEHGFYRVSNYKMLQDNGVRVNYFWVNDIHKAFPLGAIPALENVTKPAEEPDNLFITNQALRVHDEIISRFGESSLDLVENNFETPEEAERGMICSSIWEGKEVHGYSYYLVEMSLQIEEGKSMMVLSYSISP